MVSCSVVIVSYHTGPVLFDTIARALAQESLAEVIVVDNGNPPEALARLKSAAESEPQLKVISGHGNIGFARGCNLGAKQSTGDFLLLLNPDSLLPPGALKQTISALETHPNATLAGCQLINPDGTPQRGSRRQLLTPRTMLESLGLARFNLHKNDIPSETISVPAISGAFMCIRRRDYEKLGGMDEDYFLHVEDLDLCYRIHQAGGEVIFVPQVVVTHLLSTSDAPSSFVERCKARSFVTYFRKHFSRALPPGGMLLLTAAIHTRCWLKIAKGKLL